MKKKIFILMLGFLLIAVNLYAAGDLIVEGNVGIGTTNPAAKLDVNGSIKINGGIWADGNTGSTPTSGAGTRLMWIPAKGAFRAGEVGSTGTQWDDANIGIYSFATGYNTKANGPYSVAFGIGAVASGGASFASGAGITASGNYAIATGDTVMVSGDQSFGGGYQVFVSGNKSFGFGERVTVSGNGAFGLGASGAGGGGDVIASGNGSFAGGAFVVSDEAFDITASGTGSFAWGYLEDYEQIVASGIASMAVGRNLSAEADYAYAFGKNFGNNIAESFAVGFGQIDLLVRGGNVGIGTTNPQGYKLYVNGAIYASGGYYPSDIKFKDDIAMIESPLNKILNIRGVSYKWKTEEYKDKGFSEGTHYGVIGQEIEKVLPDVVKESPNGEKSVSYTELIPVLIEAVKEQQKVIEELKAEVRQLKAKDLIARSQ